LERTLPTRSLRPCRAALRKKFARFPAELDNDQIVRFAQHTAEFIDGQSLSGFQRDPLSASEIRRGYYSGAFRKFSEILRRALKRKPDRRDLQHGMRKHFVRNFEREITFPDRLFRGSGEPKANFA